MNVNNDKWDVKRQNILIKSPGDLHLFIKNAAIALALVAFGTGLGLNEIVLVCIFRQVQGIELGSPSIPQNSGPSACYRSLRE